MPNGLHLEGGLYIQSRRHGRSRRADDVTLEWLAEITGGRLPAEPIEHVCVDSGIHSFDRTDENHLRGWGTCGWSQVFQLAEVAVDDATAETAS